MITSVPGSSGYFDRGLIVYSNRAKTELLAIPKKILPPTLRVLPLDGFPPVTIGALWRGRKTPLLQVFLDELQTRAGKLI